MHPDQTAPTIVGIGPTLQEQSVLDPNCLSKRD